MKLSRLYSNQPEKFDPINFLPGLNVVLAEIRLPENKDKDTHNLGKTTLGALLDFCLLSTRNKNMFLFRHQDLFNSFVFYLEIQLQPASFVTVRRSVAEPSRISFKQHHESWKDFVRLPDEQWDHLRVPFDRSRQLLDGLLDLRAVKPWDFRKGIGYQLRSQDDYGDVFQLRKFRGEHADWKPYIAHILGLNADLIADQYASERQAADLEQTVETLRGELIGASRDISAVEGLLQLKSAEARKKQAFLDSFDFRPEDLEKTEQLVDDIDRQIARRNADRYSLSFNLQKVLTSLEAGALLFDPEEAETLFREVGVTFAGQIKRDFEQLVAFNRAITQERQQYLNEERRELEAELVRVNADLEHLGQRRSENLAFLKDTDVFGKYRKASDELATLRADVISLDNQRVYLHRLQELREKAREVEEDLSKTRTLIEREVGNHSANPASVFSSILLLFDDIVTKVIDHHALIRIPVNNKGHIEFHAEIVGATGEATSEHRGHSYLKLLCVAFDLAMMLAHQHRGYPQFVYHDGVFESLDNRKKEKLLSVLRDYADKGIQQIITLIDSDMPPQQGSRPVFSDQEIVLTLHDQGPTGRLFKIENW